jgi:hypothetical protein
VRFLYADDLAPFVPDIDPAKAEAMIEDAEAMAALLAPCITDPGFTAAGALKAILRGAVIRWHEAGTGALQAQTAGPYSQTYDTRQERRGMFLTSEIYALQGLCSSGNQGVYTVSIAGA